MKPPPNIPKPRRGGTPFCRLTHCSDLCSRHPCAWHVLAWASMRVGVPLPTAQMALAHFAYFPSLDEAYRAYGGSSVQLAWRGSASAPSIRMARVRLDLHGRKGTLAAWSTQRRLHAGDLSCSGKSMGTVSMVLEVE